MNGELIKVSKNLEALIQKLLHGKIHKVSNKKTLKGGKY